MVATTTETLTVDGVALNTLAKNVESLTGRLRTPAMRTKNIVIPGRHGSLRPASRLYDDNTIVLPMWVRGCDDDGAIPGGSSKRREFYKRVDELQALFSYHKRALTIQHTLPDGTIREAKADVLDVVDFTMLNGGGSDPTGRFIVTLQMNDPFWHDTSDITQTITGTPGGITSLASFAGATAPMDELKIRFTGPINNPTITAVYDSATIPSIYATYQENLGSGQWVEFDCATWDFTTGGGAPAFAFSKWAHSGGSRFFTLFPHKTGGTPQIHWAGGGSPTGTTALRLVGRRKFMAG